MSGEGTNSESASRTNHHAYLPRNLEASERFHPVEHISGEGTNSESTSRTNRRAYLPRNL